MMNKEQEDALKNKITDDQDSFEQHFKEQEKRERIVHYAEIAMNGLVSRSYVNDKILMVREAFEIALAMYDHETQLFDNL